LQGSIPSQGLLELAQYRAELRERNRPPDVSEKEWEIQSWKLTFVRLEHWLDSQSARRDLEAPRLAQIIVDSLFHFAGQRYDLWSYVVMPSHIHWLFQPRSEWVEALPDEHRTPRQRVIYSLNRFTSTACNRLLGIQGPFWQRECYDHWVRDVDELERIIRYIEENPVKAGLVETPELWRFSSAWARKALGLEWGMPLLKNPAVLSS
jgi:type I restriction enzyme R subunit